MAAYLERGCQFVIVARKTAPLLARLREAEWKLSSKTDADAQCEFTYQPDRWEKAFRFVALRYEQPPKPANEGEQYQLFATGQYTYRVLVTDQQWYYAYLRWAVMVEGKEGLRHWEEAVHIFLSDDRDTAFRRALEIGHQAERSHDKGRRWVESRLAQIVRLDCLGADQTSFRSYWDRAGRRSACTRAGHIKKIIVKPCAGKPQARFEKGLMETGQR